MANKLPMFCDLMGEKEIIKGKDKGKKIYILYLKGGTPREQLDSASATYYEIDDKEKRRKKISYLMLIESLGFKLPERVMIDPNMNKGSWK